MVKQIKFYRSAVQPALLKSITKRRNLPGLVQCLGILLFYCATTALCLFFFLRQQWVLMVAACYVHSMFSNFLGMESSVHELSHKTPFRTKWLNELFYGIFCLLTWNNPIHFRESHRRHHQYTVYKGIDKEVVLEPGSFSKLDYLSWFFFDWKKFRMIARGNLSFIFGRDVPDFFFWDPLFQKDDPQRKKMFWWARIQLLLHIGLGVLFWIQGWYVLLYTVSCSYFFATFLSRGCEIVQHQGMPSDVPDWRLTCHTMIFGPVMAFFYWRMNYHIEHHMYAAVPFWNLHKLHKAIAEDTPEPTKGFFRGVQKIMTLLKRQKKDPSWSYVPDLPESAARPNR